MKRTMQFLLVVFSVFVAGEIFGQCSTTVGGTICDSTKSFTNRGLLYAHYDWQSKVIPQTGYNYVNVFDSANASMYDMMVLELYTCGTNDLQLNISPGYAMSVVKYNLNNENCGGSANNEHVIIYGKGSNITVYIMKNNCGATTDTVTLWYRRLASYPSNADGFGNQNAGAGEWIGEVYKWNNVPGYYFNNLGTTGNRPINFTLDTGSVVPLTNGCSVCPSAATTDSFSVRFRMDSLVPRGFYKITCNTSNDMKVSCGSGASAGLLDYWNNGSSSSSKTVTQLFVQSGTQTYNPYTGSCLHDGRWTYELKKATGNFKADITICQMDGDYTWGNNVWNAYVFDGNGTSFNNYIGQFGSSTPYIGYNWTNGQPTVNTSTCSQSMDDSLYKVHFLMKYNFAAGNYKFRIRSYNGGQTLLTDRKGVNTAYLANYTVNNHYDVTTAYNYLSGDTFLMIKVYEQGGTKSISYNHCRQPKDVGHITAAGGSGSGDTVCNGNTVTLTADTTDGTETQWWKGATCGTGTLIATGASINVTPDSSTTFYARNRNYCVNSNDTLNKIDLFSANCTSRRITLVSKPGAPTNVTPSSATAICSGASLNLNGTSSGNTIYWFTQSSGGSAIGNSTSGANYSVSPSASTTYYAESKAGTGCVSATRTATGTVTVNANPSAPYFTWGDTLLFVDSVSNICYFAEDTDSVTIRYSIWSGNAVIDSVNGCLSSHDSSNFTVRATARNSFGCSTAKNLVVKITNLTEPTIPIPQEATTSAPYTFVFDSVTGGNNADQIEWAFNSDFANSTIVNSPTNISVTLEPGSDTLLWIRSINSNTGAVSRHIVTRARALVLATSNGLLDKTNWELKWGDEFNYNPLDFDLPNNIVPANFSEHWDYQRNQLSDCKRLIEDGDQTSLSSEDEISVDTNHILHLTGHSIPNPYYDTCGGYEHHIKYLTGEISSNIGLDTTYVPNDGCWEVEHQFYLGMFEVRCKLPTDPGVVPAFWLWNRSEIDIMENKITTIADLQTGSSTVHDWDNGVPPTCSRGVHSACAQGYLKATLYDFSQDFHIYSCVWGTSKISFFVDGKETFSESSLLTHPQALKIILGTPTFDVANQVSEYDFAIDYVRVYKPVEANTNYQCLQNITGGEAETMDGTGSAVLLQNTWSTQTTSTNIATSKMCTEDVGNNIKVYYRGTDGRCYNAYQSNGKWYEYPLMWNVTDVGDDVTYFDGRVYYRAVHNGIENELKYFIWNSTTGKWENYSTGQFNCGGFIKVSDAGTVLYKGYFDSNLYTWAPDNTTSQISTDGSVEGGIVYDGCGCLIFYREKNTDNLRQWYWWNGVWNDLGAVVTNGKVTNHTAYDDVNSIVYFIGNDKKIYSYQATYASATNGGLITLYNMLGDDNAVSDLVLSPNNNILYYVGDNGQIWYYYNDLEGGSKLNGRWHRSSITYPHQGLAHNNVGTLCMNANSGRLFYSYLYGGQRILHSTDWKNADNEFDCSTTYQNNYVFYKKGENDTATNANQNSIKNSIESEQITAEVYPNPSSSKFIFRISNNVVGKAELIIKDINGKKIAEITEAVAPNSGAVTFTWDAEWLNDGMYFYKLKAGDKIHTGKLIKIQR